MYRAVVAVALATVACGGRTELGVTSLTDASADDALDDRRDASGDSGPCGPDGVRVCGGDCPWLGPDACAGGGCTAAEDRQSFASEPAGVCWSDMGQGGLVTCDACPDGDVCVQRDEAHLICTSPAVCDALWDIGAATVCRYADKTAYTRAPLLEPAGSCPVAETGVLCGGACGGCDWPLEANRCSGRSATRAFGVCTYDVGSISSSVVGCAVDPSGVWLRGCPPEQSTPTQPPKLEQAVCFVYDDGADEDAARAYATCMPISSCKFAAQAVGGHCFAQNGVDMK